MKRTPEPELMDGAEQARAYAQADLSEPNELFLRLLADEVLKVRDSALPQGLADARALDLGCGPADIVVRLLKRYPQLQCDALDGSQAMLDLARQAIDRLPGIASRVRLLCDKLPSAQLDTGAYDLILSNSLLHHLHEPQVLWRSIRAAAKPGALVLVMDLMRPGSAGMAEALVETYAADAPPVLRQDFRNSLHAAFEPAEVEEQLRSAGLAEALEVDVVSDRHLAVWGKVGRKFEV
ncbi:trans-aconitate 2-methyltransferase [Thiohalocapsa sp. ML1]|jgi:SAM-dependent methyltransferase|uniref:class I SAM-dependent methyltransferase n=1 Tax=Thiohalocapsa sp. ML1 TaxID=1431688 RepID=UPI00073225E1|nr:class I SAM-dependent methyltransferase [Thiohalocapsa sp. ML1]